jgi:manganese-dependent inorganic pyrophosphatase
MYREEGKKPEIHLAGLLLSAILTDTLMLKSPSTTKDDKEIARWLNKEAKIDMGKHFEEIFAAKSDISGLSISDLIKKDFKEYHFNHNVRMGIAMFETIAPEQLLAKREAILAQMNKFKKAEKLSQMIFVIVDINKMASYVIPSSQTEEETIKKIFKVKKVSETLRLPGIVSRKTQIVPVLEEHFSKQSS